MKTIMYNGIKFKIDDDGRLVKMTNLKKRKMNITIPSAFPTGEVIKAIGKEFCDGNYSEITIDNGISEIEEGAFVAQLSTLLSGPRSVSQFHMSVSSQVRSKRFLTLTK